MRRIRAVTEPLELPDDVAAALLAGPGKHMWSEMAVHVTRDHDGIPCSSRISFKLHYEEVTD